MKFSTMSLVGLLALCAACGSKKSDESTASGPALDSDEVINQGKILISANDCMTCHDKSVQRIGPAQEAIAKKYEFTKQNVDMLVNKVKEGGSGVWGQVPMTPHPDLPKENAEKMVAYILSLDGEKLH